MRKRSALSRDAAESLAIQMLTFIAEDTARLGRFLAASGIEAHAIRAAARAPEFLAGVLEHVLSDEPLLRAFADHAGIDPAAIAQAHAALAQAHPRREVP